MAETAKIEITTAENCGFCFGVKKAVDILSREIELGKTNNSQVYMFGKIIHNDSFIRELTENSKGFLTIIEDSEINNYSDFENNSSVVIRTHGIPKKVFERLKEISSRENLKIADATCECVKKMHRLAEENTNSETLTLIFGDKNHPEIIGLESYVNGEKEILRDFGELSASYDKISKKLIEKNYKKLIILVQTTHNIKDYIKCKNYILEIFSSDGKYSGMETVFFDTVCSATGKRQAETESLSQNSDIMVIVGGRNSSNTAKLYEICKKNCANSFIVETSEQLPLNIFKNLCSELEQNSGKDAVKVSITAGASTPDSIIMEVKKIMTDNIIDSNSNVNGEKIEEGAVGSVSAANADANSTEEKSFAQMLDETFATLNRGDRIKGTISYISDGEIHVDLGFKYTGILAFDEITDDNSVKLKEMFKVGDEIETQVIKTNDQEGIALLSRKRIDSTENWDKIIKLYEEGTVVEGKVIQVVNGGIIVLIDSIKVFVPASHADVSKDTDLQTLVDRKVKVKIIDINTVKRRAIASIRNASAEARKAVEEKVWGEIEIGKKYQGVVKSIANYGVFVDIGGIDGMIHITELSWSRIKHPSEVLKLGDKIEVYIKDFDKEKHRISLGYRDESTNPWTKFTAETKVGDVVDAKILNMMPFGAFAEIVPGVDGLIHISQIVNKKISKPSEILNIGDIVQVKITEINPEAKKISLSMRALLEPEQVPEEQKEEVIESGGTPESETKESTETE